MSRSATKCSSSNQQRWEEAAKCLSRNFKATSLDSLATSSNQSEQSLSDESHDSDSGAETKAKGQGRFAVKCEVYSEGSSVGERKMEPIPEEEPKVSVKEILARFENLKEKKQENCKGAEKDLNNNSKGANNVCNNVKTSQHQQNGGISNNNSNDNGGEQQRAPVSRFDLSKISSSCQH